MTLTYYYLIKLVEIQRSDNSKTLFETIARGTPLEFIGIKSWIGRSHGLMQLTIMKMSGRMHL